MDRSVSFNVTTVGRETIATRPRYDMTISKKGLAMMKSGSLPMGNGLNYDFDGSISEEVLHNYLARCITMLNVAGPENDEVEEDVRFLMDIGAKFVVRAASTWLTPPDDEAHFAAAERFAKLVHARDPEVVLQAAIFETAYPDIVNIEVPGWVFEAFGQPAENRTFDYEAMLYEDGQQVGIWDGPIMGSVPDMSRLETRMWFFYRAKRYIDAGYEAIHFGQVHLMDRNDPDYVHWRDILGRVRAYAKQNARRRFLLADAHTYGVVVDGHLLFDLNAWPLRPREIPGEPLKAVLEAGHGDAIYGKSRSGITPSGWMADPIPYRVEFDNLGASSGKAGQIIDWWWTWGYEEISWFAHLDEQYRNEWLAYAYNWVRENDPAGWFQMPGKQRIDEPLGDLWMYRPHMKSAATPDGFGQEETIKRIWDEYTAKVLKKSR